MEQRTDNWTALLIDAAINAAATHGPSGASAELVYLGIAPAVVDRVLNLPAKRRRYDVSTKAYRRVHTSHRLIWGFSRRNRVLAAYIDAAKCVGMLSGKKHAEDM